MQVIKHEDGSATIELDKYEVIDLSYSIIPLAKAGLRECFKQDVQDFYLKHRSLHGYIEKDKAQLRSLALLEKVLDT